MSDKTYELSFDKTTGRYRAETINADLVNRTSGMSCELESVEFEYPEDRLKITPSFEPGATEISAEVDLVDEVYEGEDFMDIVGTEIPVTLKMMPRMASEGGGRGAAPVVEDTFTVRCGPVPIVHTLVEPGKDELPLPAVGGEPRDLVLRLTMGAGGKPWSGLELRWERLEGGCSKPGELEGESKVTDEDGTIRLTYTAPRLHYTPGDDFSEEYRFLGTGDREGELFRLKIPLAPLIVYRMKAEKLQKIGEEEYGIRGPLTEVVEIDPRERVKSLEGIVDLEVTARGETRKFPVKDMECTLLLGDENGVPEDQEGIRLTTDEGGTIRWEIPELVEAFEDRGTTYELSVERGELPGLELAEATRKALEFYETRFDVGGFPAAVFQGGLEETLRKYRFVHSDQLAGNQTAAYEKIRDTLEVLGIGVRYVRPFHRCFSEQFSPLLGVLGDTFWDFFNYIWNLKDLAGKIIGGLSSGASAIARAIAKRCEGSVSFLRSLLGRVSPLQWALTRAVTFVEWLVSRMGGLGKTLGTWAARLRTSANSLAEDATKIFTLLDQVESRGLKALAGLVVLIEGLLANISRAVGALFDAVVGVLEKLAFWLMTRVAAGLRVFEKTFFEYLEGYAGMEAIHRGIEYFMKAIELHWHGKLAGEGVMVQVGNYLQSVLESFFGKGTWIGEGASRGVSGFATLKLFDPAATVAVRELHEACVGLRAAGDPEGKLDATRGMASSVSDIQLTSEKSFIVGEAIKMFVDSMKIPVQVALTAVVTLTTLGGGTVAVASLCTKMELIISTLAICLLDVPHAITIFLGACLIQQAYLTSVANLEA